MKKSGTSGGDLPAHDAHIQRTYAVLSYLQAALQGKFAFLNVLSQLEFVDLNKETLLQTKQEIAHVHDLMKKFWKQEVIFNTNWTKPETFEAKEVVEMLEKHQTEVRLLIAIIAKILLERDLSKDQEATKYIIAAYAWYAYARDNYLRLQLDFEKKYQASESVAYYEKLLEETRIELDYVHFLLKDYRADKEKDLPFYLSLRQSGLILPGTLKTHVHDINLLLAPYRGGISFEKVEIDEADGDAWRKAQIEPEEAGYWSAYLLKPDEVLAWKSLGFFDPSTTSRWRIWGFDPITAAFWIEKKFSPLQSLLWMSAGFSPDKADFWRSRGIQNPREVPSDPL
jgi:hypothetical protein